jgi:basic membrane protein A
MVMAQHMRRMSLWCVIIIAALSIITPSAYAQQASGFHPVLVYDGRNVEGRSGFLDMIQRGAKQAEDELGIEYDDAPQPATTTPSAHLDAICKAGATHIIAVGFDYVTPVLTLAKTYPAIKFTVIDGELPPLLPNIQSITFKDNEGAFLVGMVAAKVSPSSKLGFIGGMDVPVIHNFAYGFEQGAAYAREGVRVQSDYLGTTDEVWNSPDLANILARKQYASGVDVIFTASGGSSVGVLRAASELGKYAIGVDSNQNGLYPKHVLTSMVKRIDMAVYDTLVNDYSGKWASGVRYLGIRENAFDYAVDVNNKDLLSESIIDAVEQAKDNIIRGELTVKSYKEASPVVK